MGEVMNSPKGVKAGVPERVNISCPTCGTRHDLPQITYDTVGEQTIQHMRHRCQICEQGLYDHKISKFQIP